MFKLAGVFFLVLSLVSVCFAAFAFASSNTGLSYTGREGASEISGWNISNIQYRLADDPSMLSAIAFELDGYAKTVKVSLSSSTATFFDCVNVSGTNWVCDLYPQLKVSELDEVRVVAVGNH